MQNSALFDPIKTNGKEHYLKAIIQLNGRTLHINN
jgi:hypothetical protein